jgi:hypothetical protein
MPAARLVGDRRHAYRRWRQHLQPKGREPSVRRLLTVAASVAILLLILVPSAFAADPTPSDRGAIIAVNGSVDVPAGQHVGSVVLVNGTANIHGAADTIVIAGGTATLTGATAHTLVVVDGTVTLGAGTTVTGDVHTLRSTVNQLEGSTVDGQVLGIQANLAAFALLLIPLLIVLTIGFAIVMLVAGLTVAAFGSRQVREVEDLITAKPGHVLVAGIAATVVLPLLSFLLIVTIVGAPLGFTLLFAVLPVLALLGWLVAAIWIGDWLIARGRGAREPGRPYRAAVLGVVVLAVAGVLPFVGAIATLFGFGGLILAMWRMLRPETTPPAPVAWTQPVPNAG